MGDGKKGDAFLTPRVLGLLGILVWMIVGVRQLLTTEASYQIGPNDILIDAQMTEDAIDAVELQRRRLRLADRRYLTLPEFTEFCHDTPGCYLPPTTAPLTRNEVLFVVATSGAMQDVFMPAILRTWGAMGMVFAFSDRPDENLSVFSPPGLLGANANGDDQKRQPKGFKWLMQEPQFSDFHLEDVKWVVFADDDTWINAPRLLGFLGRINYELPLAMGYFWDEVFSHTAHMSAGAGMIFSAAAAQRLGQHLYGGRCKAEAFSGVVWADVLLSTCAHDLKALSVHSYLFHAKPQENLLFGGQQMDPSAIKEAFTFHVATADEQEVMTDIVLRNLKGAIERPT
ncbi:unnamed protein product [Pedinophyceae sp. YPF-701]|nr:unnamed protein product [Pedinophyceae sp. YPF-701]